MSEEASRGAAILGIVGTGVGVALLALAAVAVWAARHPVSLRKPSDSLSASETPLTCGVALSLLGRVVGNLLAGGSESRIYAACDISWASSPFGGSPLVRDLGGIVLPDAIGLSSSNPGTPRSSLMSTGDSDGIRSFLQTYVPRWDESEKLEDLGLDSLDFARMRAELARQFGKQVPLTAIAQPGQSLGALYELLSDL